MATDHACLLCRLHDKLNIGSTQNSVWCCSSARLIADPAQHRSGDGRLLMFREASLRHSEQIIHRGILNRPILYYIDVMRETHEDGQSIVQLIATYVPCTIVASSDNSSDEEVEDDDQNTLVCSQGIAIIDHEVDAARLVEGQDTNLRQVRRLQGREGWIRVHRIGDGSWYDPTSLEMWEVQGPDWTGVRRNSGIVCDRHSGDIFWLILICPTSQQQHLSAEEIAEAADRNLG